jgi:hypothetical protein
VPEGEEGERSGTREEGKGREVKIRQVGGRGEERRQHGRTRQKNDKRSSYKSSLTGKHGALRCPLSRPFIPPRRVTLTEKRFRSFLPYRRRFLTPTRGCLPKHVHVLGSGQILGSLDHVTEREERGEEVPCEQGERLERREGRPRGGRVPSQRTSSLIHARIPHVFINLLTLSLHILLCNVTPLPEHGSADRAPQARVEEEVRRADRGT